MDLIKVDILPFSLSPLHIYKAAPLALSYGLEARSRLASFVSLQGWGALS